MRQLRTMVSSLILTMLVASITFPRSVQKEDKDSPETLIRAARFLEQKPLDKKAQDVRIWALTWIIATDKITVKVCSLVFDVDRNYKYTSEVFEQYSIGMAAFKLANPDTAKDEDAAQLAGVESALLSYESIVKAQPEATNRLLDDLLAKRGQGKLARVVTDRNCKSHR